MTQDELFKVLVAHCKEYGFIFPSSEIYDGLAAVYDYGQMGVELKNNIKQYWWNAMTRLNENIVGIDSCVFMHPKTWVASGHVAAFNDPLIDNKDSKKRYRADNLIEDYLGKIEEKMNKEVEKGRKRFGDAFDEEQFRATNPNILREKAKYDEVHNRYVAAEQANDLKEYKQIILDCDIVDPISGTKNWTDVRQFNLMFSTQISNTGEADDKIYLRPETAQGIFIEYLNVQKTGRMKIPFGIAQIGKAFRNEIVARQFIFRMREFEQMEMEFFCRPGTEMEWFKKWKENRMNGTSTSGWVPRTTVSTITRNWPTTPTPRPTSSSTSRSVSRSWRESTPVPTSTSATIRDFPERRSSTSILRPTRATFLTAWRPPSVWTVCSSQC